MLMEPKTAAFGYRRERCFDQQRVFGDLLAIRDLRRVVYRRAAVSSR
jgi:hypothetical protein